MIKTVALVMFCAGLLVGGFLVQTKQNISNAMATGARTLVKCF
jgi:hypothetical protein